MGQILLLDTLCALGSWGYSFQGPSFTDIQMRWKDERQVPCERLKCVHVKDHLCLFTCLCNQGGQASAPIFNIFYIFSWFSSSKLTSLKLDQQALQGFSPYCSLWPGLNLKKLFYSTMFIINGSIAYHRQFLGPVSAVLLQSGSENNRAVHSSPLVIKLE